MSASTSQNNIIARIDQENLMYARKWLNSQNVDTLFAYAMIGRTPEEIENNNLDTAELDRAKIGYQTTTLDPNVIFWRIVEQISGNPKPQGSLLLNNSTSTTLFNGNNSQGQLTQYYSATPNTGTHYSALHFRIIDGKIKLYYADSFMNSRTPNEVYEAVALLNNFINNKGQLPRPTSAPEEYDAAQYNAIASNCKNNLGAFSVKTAEIENKQITTQNDGWSCGYHAVFAGAYMDGLTDEAIRQPTLNNPQIKFGGQQVGINDFIQDRGYNYLISRFGSAQQRMTYPPQNPTPRQQPLAPTNPAATLPRKPMPAAPAIIPTTPIPSVAQLPQQPLLAPQTQITPHPQATTSPQITSNPTAPQIQTPTTPTLPEAQPPATPNPAENNTPATAIITQPTQAIEIIKEFLDKAPPAQDQNELKKQINLELLQKIDNGQKKEFYNPQAYCGIGARSKFEFNEKLNKFEFTIIEVFEGSLAQKLGLKKDSKITVSNKSDQLNHDEKAAITAVRNLDFENFNIEFFDEKGQKMAISEQGNETSFIVNHKTLKTLEEFKTEISKPTPQTSVANSLSAGPSQAAIKS